MIAHLPHSVVFKRPANQTRSKCSLTTLAAIHQIITRLLRGGAGKHLSSCKSRLDLQRSTFYHLAMMQSNETVV